jgi:hypothetical protein
VPPPSSSDFKTHGSPSLAASRTIARRIGSMSGRDATSYSTAKSLHSSD